MTANEREILRANAGAPGDPVLGEKYQAVNERHFGRALPAIPVIWEARLQELGSLIAEGFTVKGLTDGRVILLNPVIRADLPEIDRVLCHEMVHEYFFSIGDTEARHGAPFRAVLRRLSDENAFQGISATDAEKKRLRQSLEADSSRLTAEGLALKALGAEIEQARRDVSREFEELNARTSRANTERTGWPSEAELAHANEGRDLFNQQVMAHRARLERFNLDLPAFNREIDRYNLMAAYPEGLDEESLVQHRAARVP